ncbi:MAG: hypothetical protein E7680_01195 [Ruminococcaceae bacterium]|nr:hypothetical protein [Oscillospiraceae bacterium]
MDFTNFSLLYPNAETKARHDCGKDTPDIDLFTLEELGLSEFFSVSGEGLPRFLTTDPEVINYRLSVFSDMLACPELSAMQERLVPVLNDILELRQLEAENGKDDYLSTLTEIELYISSVEILHSSLSGLKSKLKSPAFLSLAKLVAGLAESDYYRELNEKLKELTKRVREIRSVTIGVNLDAQLRPESAGVLSINPDPFQSGDILEKILRMGKKSEYTCIANLVPFGKKQNENQKAALSNAFYSAINEVYKSSLHSWKKVVQTYVLDKTAFLLDLMPEFEFLAGGTAFLRALREKGYPLASPEIHPMNEHAFAAFDLYNPCVALKSEEKLVPNDLSFDETARIYVLTGPNRGGKSVITCALGLSQVLFQLGMYLPAEKIALSPVDAIYTHFPTGSDDTIDKGRLGEECARLGEIFDCVTPNSLVLLDESLSSTGSFEASYLAAEVLRGLAQVGCRALFSTHLHELAAQIEELNRASLAAGGAPIDTLVAGMESEGKRSFKILRAKPDGKSYARDIAEGYGLTYEKILDRIGDLTQKEN